MTRESLRQGLVTEQTIRDALTFARGDLFLAASYLAVTTRELDSYLRSSEELQGFVAAIATVKKDPSYDRMSVEQFEDQLDHLTRAYRIEALDIIHDMATMGFDTAAMADVKLKAAIQLRGMAAEKPKTNDQNAVLMELNQAYQQAAPRIKSIRIAQIEYADSPGPSQVAFSS